jgi:hypothetical protein
MNDATIVYCSSNMEDPRFEERIRDNILKNSGGMPIISVTQKPIDFGTNICVGDDIGVSGFNFFSQVLIGCKYATTKYIISAEADTVYGPDYFEYRPPAEDACYRNSNLYVMGDHRDYWYMKEEGATHAQIVGREFYIETLEKLFEGAPMWSATEKNFPKERFKKDDVFDEIRYYQTEIPVFQIKTHRSMRYYTNSDRTPVHELPYWGKGTDIRNHYLKDVPEVYSQL